MDIREQVIDQILNPRRENADQILEDLGLAGFPTREQVHQEIETKLLLPPDRIPEHWLPTYQMYVYLCYNTGNFHFFHLRHWQPEISIQSLLISEPSSPPTSLTFLRAGLEGRIVGYAEVSP